jgi:hypothetical protein
MKNIIKNTICLFTLVIGLYDSRVEAQFTAPYLQSLEYGTDIDYENGFIVRRNHIVFNDLSALPGQTSTPINIREVKNAVVDGYHRDSNGNVYFSFDVDTRVNGGGVTKSDIIRCTNIDCSAYSYFFNSVAESLVHININAFTLDPINGDLIFSIENDARINGALFFASDLIRFNGTDYTLAYDSFSIGFSRYKNIDAVSMTISNKFLFSFASDSVTNHIYEYDNVSGDSAIAYTPLRAILGDYYNQANINSLMVQIQPLPDFLFADGFE